MVYMENLTVKWHDLGGKPTIFGNSHWVNLVISILRNSGGDFLWEVFSGKDWEKLSSPGERGWPDNFSQKEKENHLLTKLSTQYLGIIPVDVSS